MTSDVSLNNALDFQKTTSASTAKLADDFTDFLKLLTVQLQNQDPLAPMDSTEFTSQLVSFAGVEQQINQNKKLDSLVALSFGDSFSSALNYVGKDISYLGSETYYDAQKPLEANYAVEGDSTDTTIQIYNSDKKLVFSQKLSAAEKVGKFSWDGIKTDGRAAPAGTYQIRVDALDKDNKALKTSTVVKGYVSGVETQNGTTFLLVGDRAVSVGNIINVSESKKSTTTTGTQT